MMYDELIKSKLGPRLNDLKLSNEKAIEFISELINEVTEQKYINLMLKLDKKEITIEDLKEEFPAYKLRADEIPF